MGAEINIYGKFVNKLVDNKLADASQIFDGNFKGGQLFQDAINNLLYNSISGIDTRVSVLEANSTSSSSGGNTTSVQTATVSRYGIVRLAAGINDSDTNDVVTVGIISTVVNLVENNSSRIGELETCCQSVRNQINSILATINGGTGSGDGSGSDTNSDGDDNTGNTDSGNSGDGNNNSDGDTSGFVINPGGGIEVNDKDTSWQVIVKNLTECSLTNESGDIVAAMSTANKTCVTSGGSYSATITPTEGCEISSVLVIYGSTDVTSSVYNDQTGVISISNINSKVTITVVCETVTTPGQNVPDGYYSIRQYIDGVQVTGFEGTDHGCFSNVSTQQAAGSGYANHVIIWDTRELVDVIVTMGGVDITSQCCQTENIDPPTVVQAYYKECLVSAYINIEAAGAESAGGVRGDIVITVRTTDAGVKALKGSYIVNKNVFDYYGNVVSKDAKWNNLTEGITNTYRVKVGNTSTYLPGRTNIDIRYRNLGTTDINWLQLGTIYLIDDAWYCDMLITKLPKAIPGTVNKYYDREAVVTFTYVPDNSTREVIVRLDVNYGEFGYMWLDPSYQYENRHVPAEGYSSIIQVNPVPMYAWNDVQWYSDVDWITFENDPNMTYEEYQKHGNTKVVYKVAKNNSGKVRTGHIYYRVVNNKDGRIFDSIDIQRANRFGVITQGSAINIVDRNRLLVDATEYALFLVLPYDSIDIATTPGMYIITKEDTSGSTNTVKYDIMSISNETDEENNTVTVKQSTYIGKDSRVRNYSIIDGVTRSLQPTNAWSSDQIAVGEATIQAGEAELSENP